MKTEVQSFCDTFSKELDPFGPRLERAIGALSGQSGQEGLTGLKETVLNLLDVQQRFSTLQEKIANQQAYLLIFGPLKSGKSTLMNAIAGAYVSEVSSLPAYPSLVYVKNGEERRFKATTYEGKTRDFADNMAMTSAVQEDHTRLVSAILDVERAGNEFDPKQHYPQAIRRLDVELPAQDLAESGTVLVDTPGLYSRMKFGYDQMTRDFRDTAACAIFVVKTDNLFFEKVFEEFEELLGCFSRIFLVSNIDTSKKDLQPDGTLKASLESSNPEAVIEAFRSLSISASLQKAIDDGRLNIYSVDLLKAASKRLSKDTVEDIDDIELPELESEELSETGEESAELPMMRKSGEDGFDNFLEDLTSYLNSSDYLHDFMADSLRMAKDLTTDAVRLAVSDATTELLESCELLREEVTRQHGRIEALGKLEKMDWTANFSQLKEEKDRLIEEMNQDYGRKGTILENALAEWMQTDEPWQDLTRNHLNSLLQQESRKEAETILEHLRTAINNSYGGARFNMAQMDDIRQGDLRIEECMPELLEGLGQNVDSSVPRINLSRDEIPMKRSLIDVMLFRKGDQVRQQFFGLDGDQVIPAAKKQKRLAGAGEEYIQGQLQEFARNRLPDLQKDYVDQILKQYIEHFSNTLKKKARALNAEVTQGIADCEETLRERQQALGVMEGIKTTAEGLTTALESIQEEYGIELATDFDGTTVDSEEASQEDQDADSLEVEVLDDNDDALETDDEGYLQIGKNVASAGS